MLLFVIPIGLKRFGVQLPVRTGVEVEAQGTSSKLSLRRGAGPASQLQEHPEGDERLSGHQRA